MKPVRIWLRVKLPEQELASLPRNLTNANCVKETTLPSSRNGCVKWMEYLRKSR